VPGARIPYRKDRSSGLPLEVTGRLLTEHASDPQDAQNHACVCKIQQEKR
jgi:hypothetical protein